MTHPFRFGLQLLPPDRDSIVAAARGAEEFGYDEMFSADHLGHADPFIPLMVAAEATSRLRVGPLVLNNELHHPVLLARTAATVDRLTGGRLVLGLGTGYAQSEHDAAGIPLREPPARVRRFGESIEVLRALLTTGSAHFDGEFHTVAVDDLGVTPAQESVPLLIGGHGRRVVEIAAHHADIFQFTGLTHGEGGAPQPGGFAIEDVRRRNEWLDSDAGDRLSDIERSILVQTTHIGAGADAAIEAVAEQYGFDRGTVDESPFLLLGSLDQVVDKLERVRDDLGVSHVVVRDAEGFAPLVEALRGR